MVHRVLREKLMSENYIKEKKKNKTTTPKTIPKLRKGIREISLCSFFLVIAGT